jgi:hypothetical protein
MGNLSRSWLPLVLCLAGAAVGRAEDDPRALVARAIAAQGSADRLTGAARLTKFKGALSATILEGSTFHGEVFLSPRGRVKTVTQIGVGDTHVRVVQALDGANAWRSVDGRTEDLKGSALASVQDGAHVERVLRLVPLLKDADLTLKPLGKSSVDGRPALGVRVTCKGRPDVNLYFDRASHLLVKYSFREREAASHDVLHETVLSDYREPDLAAADEKALRAAGQAVTGPALLELLRKQTPPAVDPEAVRRLIRQLGDDDFDTRQKASAELVKLGSPAAVYLREAAKDADAEVARRARECLGKIGQATDAVLVGPAIRLTALRDPDGAAEVLLTLALRSRDPAVVREAQAALAAVAVRDGKPDPVLVKALADRDPQRRAVAAAALGRDGGSYAKQPGRRLYLTGLRLPMKFVTYADGKKLLEREVISVEFFNEFEDSVFARPR